jgi:hypothetical protein
MNFFKKALSALLASTMMIPTSVINIVGATETDNSGAYTVSLTTPENGTMSFTDASKNASTADQSGYQLVQVDDDGNLVEIDNDGSIWAFSKGDTVEIKLTPDTGYAVESFSIKDTSTGNVLASKETSDNIFSFTMVGKNISIESTFVSLVGDDQAIPGSKVPRFSHLFNFNETNFNNKK